MPFKNAVTLTMLYYAVCLAGLSCCVSFEILCVTCICCYVYRYKKVLKCCAQGLLD